MKNKEFVASDGAKINYIDVGSGKPILFLHGFSGSLSNANSRYKILSKHFRCVAFDLRGYGKSEAQGKLGLQQSAKDAKDYNQQPGTGTRWRGMTRDRGKNSR